MKKIIVFLLIYCRMTGLYAQDESYRGGIADGYSLSGQVTTFGNPVSFQPYTGGNGDGYSTDSLIGFAPSSPALLFAPYHGSIGDGYAGDSSIAFPQYASILMFAPFLGSHADGYSSDSSITFNQHDYITMYQPYGGGIADGWTGYPVLGVEIVPVNLLSFTGEQLDKKHLLTWITAQEHNSAYFEVQRSNDARHFTSIGTVAAAGFSSIPREYHLTDGSPMEGNNFYRLKQVDTDGSYEYSNIVLLKVLGNGSMMAVYPNPTTRSLHVLLGGLNDNSKVNAGIFDMSGRLVKEMNLQKTAASFNVDVNHLPAGMYSLRIIWKGETTVWRFIKQ